MVISNIQYPPVAGRTFPIAAPSTCPGELPTEVGEGGVPEGLSLPGGVDGGVVGPPPGGGIIPPVGKHEFIGELKILQLIFSLPIVTTLIMSPVAIRTAPLLPFAIFSPVFKSCVTLLTIVVLLEPL